MKLIEAMKQIKDLLKKADDLRAKIAVNSAHMSFETPVYGLRQAEQVKEWLQAHSDIVKKILELRLSVQYTNIMTLVTIELGGKQVTQSIAAWIHRRRDLSDLEMMAYIKLTDRGLKEGKGKTSQGEEFEAKITRNFDPKERDTKISLYSDEPGVIDAKLEVVNAVTDLIPQTAVV